MLLHLQLMDLKKSNPARKPNTLWHLQLRYRNHMAKDTPWNVDVQEVTRPIGWSKLTRNHITVVCYFQGQEEIFWDRWWWVFHLRGALLLCAWEGWKNDKIDLPTSAALTLRQKWAIDKVSDLLPLRRWIFPRPVPVSVTKWSKLYWYIIVNYLNIHNVRAFPCQRYHPSHLE